MVAFDGDGAVHEFAPAKVNLCLHITGRRADGYHLLDSLVVFASVGDELSFARAETLTLEMSGPFAGSLDAGSDNLIFKAAGLLGDNVPGAAVSLNKGLPVAAGIGGGSADAAASLRGLMRLYALNEIDQSRLDEMALELGADVPSCLRSSALRMAGIGEEITEIEAFPALPAVLVNPGVPVPTGPIFKALGLEQPSTAGRGLDDLAAQPFASVDDVVGWLSAQRNDLQEPAIALAPVVGEVLDALKDEGTCRLARMSGSGATCFGLFDSEDEAAASAAHLARAYPGWWVRATSLS